MKWISPIQKLRLTILLYSMLFIGVLVWTLNDQHATCKVPVISEKAETILYKYGTQQQAQIVSISLNNPWQKLFLNNMGTSKIYRSDLIIIILAYAVLASILSYFKIYENANPFHKSIEKLLSGIFIFLSLYILCRGFFFIDSYNIFIDARLPEGFQQYKPHDSNPSLIFLILPIFDIYKYMIEKGKTYKEEIDMVV